MACGGVQNRLFWGGPAGGAKGNAHISVVMSLNGVLQDMVDCILCGLQFGVCCTCMRAAVPPQYRCMGCHAHGHI